MLSCSLSERFPAGAVHANVSWSWGVIPERPVAMSEVSDLFPCCHGDYITLLRQHMQGPVLRLVNRNRSNTSGPALNPAVATAILSTTVIDRNDPRNLSVPLLAVLHAM